MEANVVHRDIKPENLMVDEKNHLVLVDFGISFRFVGENDVIKKTAGTAKFFAPEIVKVDKNKVIRGRRIDVWAAGITIYAMGSGKLPFNANSVIGL
jgi:serine/threonine protein kinase